MLGIRHPFSGALYEKDGVGHVMVTLPDGSWGLFEVNGRWIRGAVEECDPQLCGWVGGPQYGSHRLTPSTPAA